MKSSLWTEHGLCLPLVYAGTSMRRKKMETAFVRASMYFELSTIFVQHKRVELLQN